MAVTPVAAADNPPLGPARTTLDPWQGGSLVSLVGVFHVVEGPSEFQRGYRDRSTRLGQLGIPP